MLNLSVQVVGLVEDFGVMDWISVIGRWCLCGFVLFVRRLGCGRAADPDQGRKEEGAVSLLIVESVGVICDPHH